MITLVTPKNKRNTKDLNKITFYKTSAIDKKLRVPWEPCKAP
jgi:hypothetical protein